MKKLKAILSNPFLLGAQGFLAGAVFIWTSSEPAQAVAVPAPTAAAAQVGAASYAGHRATA